MLHPPDHLSDPLLASTSLCSLSASEVEGRHGIGHLAPGATAWLLRSGKRPQLSGHRVSAHSPFSQGTSEHSLTRTAVRYANHSSRAGKGGFYFTPHSVSLAERPSPPCHTRLQSVETGGTGWGNGGARPRAGRSSTNLGVSAKTVERLARRTGPDRPGLSEPIHCACVPTAAWSRCLPAFPITWPRQGDVTSPCHQAMQEVWSGAAGERVVCVCCGGAVPSLVLPALGLPLHPRAPPGRCVPGVSGRWDRPLQTPGRELRLQSGANGRAGAAAVWGMRGGGAALRRGLAERVIPGAAGGLFLSVWLWEMGETAPKTGLVTDTSQEAALWRCSGNSNLLCHRDTEIFKMVNTGPQSRKFSRKAVDFRELREFGIKPVTSWRF